MCLYCDGKIKRCDNPMTIESPSIQYDSSDKNETNFRDPSRYMTMTYVVSLSFIAILSMSVHLMLDRIISQEAKSGELINVSGQQRMLSQRISLFTSLYLNSGGEEYLNIAKDSMNTLLKNHDFLLKEHNNAITNKQASPLSDEMLAIYFNEPYQVSSRLEQFVGYVNQSLDVPALGKKQGKENEFLALAKQPLLAGFNAIVYQYERESKKKVDELRFAQSVVLYIVIVTLFVEAFFIFLPMVKRVSVYASKLQFEVNHDVLSGLLNRRAFMTLSERFFSSARRYQTALSVIMLDIDHFKNINDTHGHDVGDLAIKWLADKLRDDLRDSDCVARVGGEEFALLLPNTDIESAVLVAEKIRVNIECSRFELKGTDIPLTTSAGVSCIDKDDISFETILKRADNALYKAKHKGRNCVICLSH